MVRVKRRYVVLEIKYQCAKQKPSQDLFLRELRDKIAHMYGDFGVACLNRGFSIKRYDPQDGFMILGVRRGVHEMVMSVVSLITKVDKFSVIVLVSFLSGSIRGCLKYLKKIYIMRLRKSIAERSAEAIKVEPMECDSSE